MQTNLAAKNWLRLLRSDNEIDTRLSIELLPTVEEAENKIYLIAAYYTICHRSSAWAGELLDILQTVLAKKGFQMSPRWEEVKHIELSERVKLVEKCGYGWEHFCEQYEKEINIDALFWLICEEQGACKNWGWLVFYAVIAQDVGYGYVLRLDNKDWRRFFQLMRIFEDKKFHTLWVAFLGFLPCPDFVFDILELKVLDAHFLSKIPEKIQQLSQLERLRIIESEFDDSHTRRLNLQNFPQLRYFDISLDKSSFDLGYSDSVEELNLNFSPVNRFGLPIGLDKMKCLRMLTLKKPQVFGDFIEELPLLQELHIIAPSLQFFTEPRQQKKPYTAFSRTFAKCQKLTIEEFEHTVFPPFLLSDFPYLQSFYLSSKGENGLSIFPSELEKITTLRAIEILSSPLQDAVFPDYAIKNLLLRLEKWTISCEPSLRQRIEYIYEQMREEGKTNCELVFR